MAAADPTLPADQVIGRLLGVVSGIVSAYGYFFYVVDRAEPARLVLRGLRTDEAEMARIRIDYSSTDMTEGYEPPFYIEAGSVQEDVGLTRGSGNFELLSIPLKDREGALAGVIRVGPLAARMVPNRQLRLLREMLPALCAAARIALDGERAGQETRELTGRLQAVSLAAHGAYEPLGLIENLLDLGAGLAGGDRWILAVFGGDLGGYSPLYRGLPSEAVSRASRGLAECARAETLPSSVAVIDTGLAFGGLLQPLYEQSKPGRAVWVPMIQAGRVAGAFVCLVVDAFVLEQHKVQALSTLGVEVLALLDNAHRQSETSRSYLKMLKALVTFMDSCDVHTCGHSARIARLSREIASEMGLDRRFQEAVEVAAFLHDVGMCALESDLIYSKSRFDKSDYDAMKMHVTVGAGLVEPVIEPGGLVPVILHHHERYDGWGYPLRLKGEDIPLGARIVATADAFVAKTSGRAYRKALSFAQAIEGLKKSRGKSLDPSTVDALLAVLRRKQGAAGRRGKILEPCWEMLQCPEPVREACPAGRGDVNCWTITGVKCHTHGGECESCLVFTEYKARIGLEGDGL